MKLTNYFVTLAAACDLSNDSSYGFFKQNLAQIDSVIENYFELENMTTRNVQNSNMTELVVYDTLDNLSTTYILLDCT